MAAKKWGWKWMNKTKYNINDRVNSQLNKKKWIKSFGLFVEKFTDFMNYYWTFKVL
jgi:hypothetical protein